MNKKIDPVFFFSLKLFNLFYYHKGDPKDF